MRRPPFATTAEEAYNADGLVPRAVKMIKDKFPEIILCTDVALDPYSDQVRSLRQKLSPTLCRRHVHAVQQGHDGVVEDGKIVNDLTLEQLAKQAICHARAGADIVAP